MLVEDLFRLDRSSLAQCISITRTSLVKNYSGGADPESNYPGIGMKLKKAMEEEAKDRGALSIQMKSISALNGERMANLYIRNGYKPSEQLIY
jgi:hypothetical protein